MNHLTIKENITIVAISVGVFLLARIAECENAPRRIPVQCVKNWKKFIATYKQTRHLYMKYYKMIRRLREGQV